MTTVKYGLMVDGKLLGFDTRSNGDFMDCVGTEFSLESGTSEPTWLVNSQAAAEYVAENSTDWYNAGYETPNNSYVGKCKVVKVTLTVEEA